MNYTGIIIAESLKKTEVLNVVKIIDTRIELVTDDHQTPWLNQWTLYTIEISEQDGDEIAEKLSGALESEHEWYIDYKNDQFHYIIYRNKVFKVNLRNPVLYQDAKNYGMSLGIPEYQLDFNPTDKIWER